MYASLFVCLFVVLFVSACMYVCTYAGCAVLMHPWKFYNLGDQSVGPKYLT